MSQHGACPMQADVGGKSVGATFKKANSVSWLPDMDLNHDKQIQSLLCYRYTIGQSIGRSR